MRIMYYLVVDATNNKIVKNMGCGFRVKQKSEAMLEELSKANPSIEYRIVTKFGNI